MVPCTNTCILKAGSDATVILGYSCMYPHNPLSSLVLSSISMEKIAPSVLIKLAELPWVYVTGDTRMWFEDVYKLVSHM